ncbi:translation elongation factor Ts [Taylorella equigenitalis]|uniref:translation elongation factor Ts n=1 Tax=Taylorella equigenitalis TaxID=29575 RepID=UPI0023AEDED8|nr:translation elongation factor Ts [Taylorella equigenitalis]WED99709.1 translation elongation factor Ts [Taylorella equigenitalis]WEE01187.1 translation elongation factor Ts [Taylorella equigenitalis]WFD77724.1 translation elongation factor Ts [Taylorella equigenitalis]WFD79202.1 translation elongation factor Ts [Taylorella equigenitalis]WFD80678.1 translation elongation factor Ts [Taylorella equigenitalis]
MAEITAGMVKDLREKTDAPMMECKKALTEAEGDMVRAEEILRVKLGNKATKAASRVTAEGLIGEYVTEGQNGQVAAQVEVNCETDFVAKNPEFISFVQELAKLVATENPADIQALSELKLGDGTVESTRKDLVGKIGENMTIRRFHRVETSGKIATYNHGGRIGVLVDFNGEDSVGKDLAMHIAATKPKALDQSGINEADIESERKVATEKAQESGKPAEIVEKMVLGTIAKFLKENTLLGQPFVKNDKQTVEQMLKEKGASIKSYNIFIVGEGIEKAQSNFAEEVASMTRS